MERRKEKRENGRNKKERNKQKKKYQQLPHSKYGNPPE
jgi:hypothetical protein